MVDARAGSGVRRMFSDTAVIQRYERRPSISALPFGPTAALQLQLVCPDWPNRFRSHCVGGSSSRDVNRSERTCCGSPSGREAARPSIGLQVRQNCVRYRGNPNHIRTDGKGKDVVEGVLSEASTMLCICQHGIAGNGYLFRESPSSSGLIRGRRLQLRITRAACALIYQLVHMRAFDLPIASI